MTGVWLGQLAPYDSVRLYLRDSAGQVSALMRPFPPDIDRAGSAPSAGTSLDITLSHPLFPSAGSVRIQGEVEGDRLRGTWDSEPVVFERFRPTVTGLPGRWVLVETRNPAQTLEEWGDTLRMAVDGRVGRAKGQFGSYYQTVGVYRRSGDRAIFDYFGFSLPSVHFEFKDTLHLVGSTLVRRTALITGTFEEVYALRP